MKTLLSALLTAAAFVLGTFVVALALLARSGWLGVGDLRALGLWTALLALLVTPAALVCSRLSARWDRRLAFALAVVAGGFLGYLGTWIVWKQLGPWFGAFSFPVIYCWLAGSVLGCVVATLRAPKR